MAKRTQRERVPKTAVTAPRVTRLSCFLIAALALACIVLYLPMLRADFVWDGRGVILTNDYVHGLKNLWDVLSLHVMSRDVIDNNRPVFLLSAMCDWALWGPNALGFHLTNILLHALVAVLLFAFCRRLPGGGSPWIAFFCVLLFVVHPLNCEAVAEISYRKDLIAAAGILAALNLAASFQPVFSRKNLFIGGACALFLFLAVAAKENGVAGPAALICYWLLFRRNEPKKGWIALCGAAALVVTAFLIARFTLPPSPSIIFIQPPARIASSVWETVLVQQRIWSFYMRQIAFPMNFCADYGPFSIRHFGLLAGIATVLAVAGVQIFLSLKNRVVCMGAAIFWLSLLPVSNFIPIYRPMADRFLYLPMCGVAVMLAGLCSRLKIRIRAPAVAALAAAVCLALLTFQREGAWQHGIGLWLDTAAKNPFSFTAEDNLATELVSAGKPAEAVTAAERAIQLAEAQNADPFAILAVALDQLGRTADADAAFKKAIALDARYRDPESLVKALTWEKQDALRLEVIARRNL